LALSAGLSTGAGFPGAASLGAGGGCVIGGNDGSTTRTCRRWKPTQYERKNVSKTRIVEMNMPMAFISVSLEVHGVVEVLAFGRIPPVSQ